VWLDALTRPSAEDCLAKAEPLLKRGFSFGTDRTGRVSNGPIGGRCQENPSAITQRRQTSTGTATNEDRQLTKRLAPVRWPRKKNVAGDREWDYFPIRFLPEKVKSLGFPID
jgi:hypothetical protein